MHLTDHQQPQQTQQSEQPAAPPPPPPRNIADINLSQIDDLTPEELRLLREAQQVFLESDEVAPDRPLIADIAPLQALQQEYERGQGSFVAQLEHLLAQGFHNVRRARGDGDCFYRSLAFAYINRLMKTPDPQLAVATAVSLLQMTPQILEAAGFQGLVYDDFYDCFLSLVHQVVAPEPGHGILTDQILLEAFQSYEVSNSIVVYLRLLTSAHIRTDPDIAAFLLHPDTGESISSREFCESFVEASGKEADHPQIEALCRALQIRARIAYLDGHNKDGTVEFVDVPSIPVTDELDPIVLLYRPGHYDILERGS